MINSHVVLDLLVTSHVRVYLLIFANLFSLEDIIGDVDASDRVLDGENLLPEKRGRSRNRNTSGFYSNWKRK